MLTHLFFPVRNWSGVWLISNVRRLTLNWDKHIKNSFGHEWGRRKSIFRETNAVLHRISAPCFLEGSRDLKKNVVFLKNVSPFDVDPSQRACGGGAEPPRHPKIQNSSKFQHMSNYFQTFQNNSNYVKL